MAGLTKAAYEAVVVGSGFGGAVAACRLAQSGVDVAILERKRPHRASLVTGVRGPAGVVLAGPANLS